MKNVDADPSFERIKRDRISFRICKVTNELLLLRINDPVFADTCLGIQEGLADQIVPPVGRGSDLQHEIRTSQDALPDDPALVADNEEIMRNTK